MSDKVKKFLNLVQENPELKVIPMVETEVVADDNYSTWVGKIGDSEIRKYITYQLYMDDKQIIFYEDREEIEEYIKNHDVDYIQTDDEIKDKVESMGWKWAIFLDINTPCDILK